MRRSFALVLTALTLTAGSLLAQQDPHMARALRVLSSTPLIDGHNDLPWAIRGSEVAPHDVEAAEHDSPPGDEAETGPDVEQEQEPGELES